jgi:hypothetical protein
MAKWLIRLKGEEFDLKDLTPLVHSPNHAVIEENGLYYLWSLDFDSLDSASEVRELASSLIDVLNGAVKLHTSGFHGVSEDGVIMIEEDGRRHEYVYLGGSSAARSRASASITVITSGDKEQVAQPPRDVESWISLAETHKAVGNALHFFKEDTWTSLYKIYEIIREDVAGQKAIIKSGWATKRGLNRFTQTAQSRAAIGDLARHATSKPEPPLQPMNIKEARALVRGMILGWLSSKE